MDLTVVAGDDRAAGSTPPVDVPRWERLAVDVLVALEVTGECTLTFVDAPQISDLNADHMGVDGPTDVLAFPIDADEAARDGVPTLIGDVVVCPEVAAAQCAEHAGTYDDELALLVVHGILHLVGHDHAEPAETEAMRARELELLESNHWRGPAPRGFRQHHDPTP